MPTSRKKILNAVVDTAATDQNALNSLSMASPLLALPAELRNRVYAYAVTSEDPIDVRTSQLTRRFFDHLPYSFPPGGIQKVVKKDFQSAVMQTGLTRACRSLRIEALPLFYALNTFLVDVGTYLLGQDVAGLSPYLTMRWLQLIGPGRRPMLKKLYLASKDHNMESELSTLHFTFRKDNIIMRMEDIEMQAPDTLRPRIVERLCFKLQFEGRV